MCPKRDISVCKRRDSVSHARYQHHSMAPALRSICLEDIQDSGLSSMNLPSIDVYETYSLASTECAFSRMKIDSELQDSDKYTSHCDSGVCASERAVCGCMSPSDVSINTVCEMKHSHEDILPRNNSNCDDTLCDSERGRSVLTNIIDRLFEGDKDEDNSLHLSIINGYRAYSRLLINLAPEYDYLNLSNNLRQTALHLAVLTRQSDIVRRLVCAGAAVLAQDQQGNTPLHIACALGDVQTVKHLLTPVRYEETLENKYSIPYQRMPQDLKIRNYEGQTCLHIAANTRNFEVVQMLLDTGADINVGDGKSGRSVLHKAADAGDIEIVEMLLSSEGIKVNTKDFAGLTPAQLAYGRNHIEIVKMICSIPGYYDAVHLSETVLDADV